LTFTPTGLSISSFARARTNVRFRPALTVFAACIGDYHDFHLSQPASEQFCAALPHPVQNSIGATGWFPVGGDSSRRWRCQKPLQSATGVASYKTVPKRQAISWPPPICWTLFQIVKDRPAYSHDGQTHRNEKPKSARFSANHERSAGVLRPFRMSRAKSTRTDRSPCRGAIPTLIRGHPVRTAAQTPHRLRAAGLECRLSREDPPHNHTILMYTSRSPLSTHLFVQNVAIVH